MLGGKTARFKLNSLPDVSRNAMLLHTFIEPRFFSALMYQLFHDSRCTIELLEALIAFLRFIILRIFESAR